MSRLHTPSARLRRSRSAAPESGRPGSTGNGQHGREYHDETNERATRTARIETAERTERLRPHETDPPLWLVTGACGASEAACEPKRKPNG
jgi:hypothetical protein